MANAVDMRGLEEKGSLGDTNAAVLLRALEESRATVRIWLETEIGVGQIALHEGRIVVAEVGPLRKRTALLRILSMTEGTYSVERSNVERSPSIIPSVSAAMKVLSDRQVEWRTLCEATPPMSSVLRLSAAGREAKRESTGSERIVFLLIDGRRTLMEILGESALDPIDALRIVVHGSEAGYFEEVSGTPTLMPLPTEDISGEFSKVPAPARLPQFTSSYRGELAQTLEWGGIRNGTLLGIGVDYGVAPPSNRSTGAVGIEASPIIDLGSGGESRSAPDAAPIPLIVQREFGESPSETDGPAEIAPLSEAADSLIGTERPIADASALPGIQHVGRYEVIHRIGRGGMGTVYLARLTAEGGFRRLFALKLLRSYLAQDGAATAAFLAEARLAGQLHHPNVVGVVDAGIHRGQPYLVMDYVEGCSLKQLMTGHPDFRPAQFIVPIILSALDGLSAVHNLRGDDGLALNVVHCDVSPENLLVGADGICRLTDFGVARRAQLEGSQNIHGKPGYVAPEQVTGAAIDHRVDIFALGVVLWSALTGERLFQGKTVEETLHRVCNQQVPLPSTIGLRPPSALDDICMKALERAPSRRYQSAEEMQADLRVVAMRDGLMGLNSEVAAWVKKTIGQDLSRRRLLILEAARPRELSNGNAETAVDGVEHKFITSRPPPASLRAPDTDDLESRTMRLDVESSSGGRSQTALVVAAVLAIGMVLTAILWPSVLGRLFKMDAQRMTIGASNKELAVDWTTTTKRNVEANPNAPTVSPVLNPEPSSLATSASPAQQQEH